MILCFEGIFNHHEFHWATKLSGNGSFLQSPSQPFGNEDLGIFPGGNHPQHSLSPGFVAFFEGYKPKVQDEHRAIATGMMKVSKKIHGACTLLLDQKL